MNIDIVKCVENIDSVEVECNDFVIDREVIVYYCIY